MRIIKTFIITAAADVLSLFVGFTLAGSSALLIRIISAICTAGILVCILGSFAFKTAKEDGRQARLSGSKVPRHIPFTMGATASFPALVSWLILRFSGTDFYRLHKLINGWFIQVYNFIEPNASSAALSEGEMLIMLPLAFAPMAVVIAGYIIQLKIDN